MKTTKDELKASIIRFIDSLDETEEEKKKRLEAEAKEAKAKDKAVKDASPEERLEYLRKQIENENISQGEILELQSLAKYIKKGDVQLAEWAGIPESEFNKDKKTKDDDTAKEQSSTQIENLEDKKEDKTTEEKKGDLEDEKDKVTDSFETKESIEKELAALKEQLANEKNANVKKQLEEDIATIEKELGQTKDKYIITKTAAGRYKVRDEESPDTYSIYKYSQNGSPEAVEGKEGLSLAEAKEHCSNPETEGKDGAGNKWFHGFVKDSKKTKDADECKCENGVAELSARIERLESVIAELVKSDEEVHASMDSAGIKIVKAVKDAEETEEEKKKREHEAEESKAKEDEENKTKDASPEVQALLEKLNKTDNKEEQEAIKKQIDELTSKNLAKDAEPTEAELKAKKDKEDLEAKEKKEAKETKDSWNDVAYRVGILAPDMNIKMPTEKYKVCVEVIKREALKKALTTDSAMLVEPFVKTKNINSLTGDQLDAIFIGASTVIAKVNNGKVQAPSVKKTSDAGTQVATSIRAINERNKDFWKR
jgi:hypothetical protein